MTEPRRLARTRQCAKCPWKKNTDPRDIPDGYDEARHHRLSSSIARNESGLDQLRRGTLTMMACHESPVGRETECVGWLYNQLGAGNNIRLRLAMLNCENVSRIEIDGPQHATFTETLPKSE